MVKIPEDDGVILPSALTTLERGVWRKLIVDPASADLLDDPDDSERLDVQSPLHGTGVHLYCELIPSRAAPLFSSTEAASSDVPTIGEVYRVHQRFSSITLQPTEELILLSEGTLTAQGIVWFKVGADSCPPLVDEGSSLYP